MSSFQKRVPFEKRREEARSIRMRYPARVPVIVERAERCTSVPCIDKAKFLVPSDLTVGQFVYTIRKRIELEPEKALFVFVGGTTLPPTSATMAAMDDAYRHEDGFLYMTYTSESTFGEK